jgi:hypothetical protein
MPRFLSDTSCLIAARTDAILTFNERLFQPLALHGIAIVVPS